MTRWWYATSPRATFAFAVEQGRVAKCAPIARRWLMGRPEDKAVAELRSRGYKVEPLP